MQLKNRTEKKQQRRELRQNATSAEKSMWSLLRGNRVLGRKFRRQYSIGSYIVDFCCPSEKLIVELDGAHHYTSFGSAHDYERDSFLKELGYTVLRFENVVFSRQPEAVLLQIISSFKNKTAVELGEGKMDVVIDMIIHEWSSGR
ncbi:MAG: DUF559 domain-containing protein [Chitinophagales bacterium]|nr:DUF559 domain-containing protein [Chitinophagales bacterium]